MTQPADSTLGNACAQRQPEDLAREVIDLCVSCNYCRDVMVDTPCRFFPQLYRLSDREKAGEGDIASEQMENLTGLCNMCGQCPCSLVRTRIRQAKSGFVRRKGVSLRQRFLTDVRLIGRIGGAVPGLANALMQTQPASGLIKRALGLHPGCKIPRFPQEPFAAWAKERGLDVPRPATGRKVAYFVGCSAKYLFPDVAKATVEVLQHNGIDVHIPEQRCCGIPGMLEGDREFAFSSARFNIAELLRCVEAGYDIVCSCPTCGYLYKSALRDGADLSKEYRDELKTKLREEGGSVQRLCERLDREAAAAARSGPVEPRHRPPFAPNLLLSGMLRDDRYFAGIDGRDRLAIARHTYDLGEYLRKLDREGAFDRDFPAPDDRLAYFAPCHLREQDMGYPWMDLLASGPEARMETVGGAFDCCGGTGTSGFKRKYYKATLARGRSLMDKMVAAAPDRIVTDCLSCRMQFNQELPHPVVHPVELLRECYRRRQPGTP